jgi:hypothetical protein
MKDIEKIELPDELPRYPKAPKGGCFFNGSPKRKRTRSDSVRDEIEEGMEEYDGHKQDDLSKS